MTDRIALLENENADLRERVAWLETCLLGPESYAVFSLTTTEERFFAALMSREILSKEQLLTLAYSDKVDADLPEIKIVDVFICKIRKKLKPFGFEIQTFWGRGYALNPLTKDRVRALLKSVGATRVAA